MTKLRSILLVDDDPIANFLHELLIEEMGITSELTIAKDGKEALEKISNCNSLKSFPDLILLDINMPGMNGFDFLREFTKMNLEEKKLIKIVMLTSSMATQDLEKAKEFNVNGYIPKPLKYDSIKRIISKYFH